MSWQVDVYDNDEVDSKNCLHQNFSLDDLGKSKAKVFEERSLGVVNAVERFMTPSDFANYDVVLCCVDSTEFRRNLYNFWLDEKDKGDLKYWIDGRCSSRTVVLMHAEANPQTLRENIIDADIRTGCLLQYEKDNNISQATPRIIASIVIQTFMNWLRGEATKERIMRF
jgi:molybdopterin/thiamine biosynthesis adenylyltransferase